MMPRARRCRDLLADAHPTLCFRHASIARRSENAEIVTAELITRTGEFRTFTDLNHALGRLFHLFATKRLDRRSAHTLAYISQLLLATLPGTRDEAVYARGNDSWAEHLRRALPPPPPRPVATPLRVRYDDQAAKQKENA